MRYTAARRLLWYQVSLILLVNYLFVIHHLHVAPVNECGMTMMFNVLQFLPIPVNLTHQPQFDYSMMIYNEGRHYQNKNQLSPTDIPVLFVAGSGGSGKQMRSLATILQTKCEQQNAAFRFRFFAVDFDEQFSFASSRAIESQQRFVLDAINTIASMTSNKMVLFGHSFGGFIITSILEDARFPRDAVDLLVLKSAPVHQPPVFVDSRMNRAYETARKAWAEHRENRYRQIGVVSYSGAMKDFMVPDELTEMAGIVHREAWSIEPHNLHTGTDHLCILWCKQIVRHAARILYEKGRNPEKSGREIVDEFFAKERELVEKEKSEALKDAIELKKGKLIEETVLEEFWLKMNRNEILTIYVEGRCAKSLTAYRRDGKMQKRESKDGNIVMMLSRAEGEEIVLKIDKKPNCKYSIWSTPNWVTALTKWYEICQRNLATIVNTICMNMLRFVLLDVTEHASEHIKRLTAIAAVLMMTSTVFGAVADYLDAFVVATTVSLAYWHVANRMNWLVSCCSGKRATNNDVGEGRASSALIVACFLIGIAHQSLANLLILVWTTAKMKSRSIMFMAILSITFIVDIVYTRTITIPNVLSAQSTTQIILFFIYVSTRLFRWKLNLKRNALELYYFTYVLELASFKYWQSIETISCFSLALLFAIFV